MKETLYANLLIDQQKFRSSENVFLYRIPEKLKAEVKVGSLVLAPFGKNFVKGFVLEIIFNENTLKEKYIKRTFKIKEIQKVLLNNLFTTEYLKSLERIGKIYFCRSFDFIRYILPFGSLGEIS